MKRQVGCALMCSVVGLGVLLTGCAGKGGPRKETVDLAQDRHTPMNVGQHIGDARLARVDGSEVRLSEMLGEGPVVVVFYRGGWCPYCNEHLAAWESMRGELEQAGGKLVAISPERPSAAEATRANGKLAYDVLSDTRLEAARMFGVKFEMDEATQAKYMGYGVNLAKANASGAWELPHPATFVVDRGGVVQFAQVQQDFKNRTSPADVVNVVRGL